MSVIPWYVTAVRLLVPFSILRWPLWGLLASSVVDMYDWKFVQVTTSQERVFWHYFNSGWQ